jgi:hypothetical protein
MASPAEAVVLCEDVQQRCFIQRMLVRLGYGKRIRLLPLPEGGSGEQYVRERYAVEVRAHRRSHHARCLLAVTDADKVTVQHRHNQLDAQLDTARESRRRSDESIVVLVPKRRIEAWIHFLGGGGTVSEEEEYPDLTGHESECHAAAKELARLVVYSQTPDHCPPSLERAIQQELPRLPKAGA